MNMSIFTSVITLTDGTLSTRHVLVFSAENINSAREFIQKELPLVPYNGLTDITSLCDIKTIQKRIICIRGIKE